ncbi:solute carrier family 2 facilitated glucose transporter member 5-like [Crotalus adamanteus]|uniref:Solute carrier family 2 facilitated glucose transporter member 5-like n=1 Tax=Crotalus adamanteus TaxID=8729 RepID=A0AAW1AQD8_CROAD
MGLAGEQVRIREGVPLDHPGKMEEKEDSEPTIRSNKLTRPLIFSIMGANLGFFQYGYAFSLITNPAVIKMQLLNLQYEGIDTGSVQFEFLILLSVFVPLGGLFGVYVWSCLADRYGRKCAVLIINGLSIFSSAILCFDNIVLQFEYSLFARFLAGMTSGAFSFSVPLYVLEISSLNLRGALVTTLILFFSWGYILVQILISPQIWGSEEDFSLLAGVAAIFAVISIILLALSPESPRFLHIQRNDKEKARQVLKMLRGVEDVEEEMEELYQEHLAESSQKNMTVWKLLRFRSLRWQLITVVVLVSGSRFVQTNAVLIFAQQSYKVLGLSHKAMKLLPLVGSVVIQLMLLTTICTVESLGRRFLLLSGFLICCISNIALVFTFQVEDPSLAFISIVLIILFFMGYVTGPGCPTEASPILPPFLPQACPTETSPILPHSLPQACPIEASPILPLSLPEARPIEASSLLPPLRPLACPIEASPVLSPSPSQACPTEAPGSPPAPIHSSPAPHNQLELL